MSTVPVEETPWEVSVFAALLNARWAFRDRASRHQSDIVTALDDAAETALGDVLLQEMTAFSYLS